MELFSQAVAHDLRNPLTAAPVPLWALRLALGALGDSMVPGQKIAPAAALAAGYAFETPTLDQSLRAARCGA